MGDDGIRHAVLADQHGQGARVDAGYADNAARAQPLVQVLAGPVAGGLRYRRMHNAAPDARGGGEVRCLDVLGIGAGVADVREGKHHDLPGIGRVGEDFLISGNRGVEANLACGLSNRANAEALNNQAIGQNNRGCVGAIAPCGGAVCVCCCHDSTLD